MRSKNDLQPSRQSNSANLNFLAPSNNFSQTQTHEECKVQGNINQIGGSNPQSSLFSPSKPPPAVSQIKNTQDNQQIFKTNSPFRPVAENLSINSVSQESATIGSSLWPNSQVNRHQNIDRSPSMITRPQLSGIRQDPELSNLIKINPFARNCNHDHSRILVNSQRTSEPEEEKKQASRDEMFRDKFRITIENKANEDLSFTRHQVKPQISREQAKSNPLQQVTSESDLKMIEQSFKNSNPILIENQSLNYNQASQKNSWWNQPPQNLQHFQEQQQLGVQRNSSFANGQENKDQKNISYSVESNSFYEWQDNEYEQSEKAEESKRIQEQNRSQKEKRELFNYSGSKQGSLNQARIHQNQNQSISSSYTNYSQISQDLISSNKSESKNGSLFKIGLLPSLIQSPQRKNEKLSANIAVPAVDRNIFGMNSRTLSKDNQKTSKIKIKKDWQGRDNKRQIFQPGAKEPSRALNPLGQHPSPLSSSKAKSSFIQHPLTNTSPIKRLGEQKPSEAQAKAVDGRRTKLYDYDGDSENVLYDEEYWLVEQAFQSKPQTKDSKDPILDWEETKKEDIKAKKAVENSGGPDECGEKVLFEQDFGVSARNAGGDFQSASIRKNLYKCETEREQQRSKTKTASHNFNTNPQRTTRVLYSNHQFGNCSLSSSGAFNKRSPDEQSNRKTMQAQDNRAIEEESKKDPNANNNSKEERKASDQSDGFDEFDSIVFKQINH